MIRELKSWETTVIPFPLPNHEVKKKFSVKNVREGNRGRLMVLTRAGTFNGYQVDVCITTQNQLPINKTEERTCTTFRQGQSLFCYY